MTLLHLGQLLHLGLQHLREVHNSNDHLGLKPTVSIFTRRNKRKRVWLNNSRVGHQGTVDLGR